MASLKPPHYRVLCKVFEKDGWKFSHQKGDHLVYKKPGAIRPVVIPMYSEIPVFIVLNNLRTAGISRNRYLQLLKA
ncbi:MAG: type II toxin-antitoxin system HicA family toxin [Patescibacteria group bacterium]|nr:type II toxin-antitoxin system HicA family toxin [Patescibacteria group bacterium]MCL5432432.1 type II toxin-antitoxin system HicA family toxin [Patescibacteria group bacterium]